MPLGIGNHLLDDAGQQIRMFRRGQMTAGKDAHVETIFAQAVARGCGLAAFEGIFFTANNMEGHRFTGFVK